MDPISRALISAITAGVSRGATSGATLISTEALIDEYMRVKNWIVRKLGRDAEVTTAIAKLEQSPDSQARQSVLVEEIASARIAYEPELLALAQQLIEALKETAAGSRAVAKFQVDARGAQVGVMGDNAKIEGGIHFGGK